MNNFLMVATFILIGFSTVVSIRIHGKIQYTSYRDLMTIVWWSTIAQILVLLLLGGTLMYRHVRIVDIGWW